MKKTFLIAFFTLAAALGTVHGGNLSIQDYHLGLKVLNVGGDNSWEGIRNTSFGMYAQFNGSLVDILLQSFGLKVLRFGDYFGSYGTLSFASYQDSKRFPLFMNLGLIGGGFVSVSLGDEIDVGAKVYYDLRLDLFDYDSGTTYTALLVNPMVRFQMFYLDAAVSLTPEAPMLALAGRMGSDEGYFLGLRFERSAKTFGTTREDVHTGLTLTLGQAY